MGDTSKYKEEKQIALGILAHVDAGKTTLSESMLHKGGIVDNIGRVDKKNAFLDNYELEKEPGHHNLFQAGGVSDRKYESNASGYTGTY